MKLRLAHTLLAFNLVLLSILFGATAASGQTSSFTYQGRLTDGGTAANGNYDLQFTLWDSLSGGTQVGSTQTLNTVAVSSGVFTVSLNFGANAFPGANRFLEISARPSGAGSFMLLSPRQPITSTPYAVRSLNAASADNVTVNGNQAFSVTGIGTFANSNTFVGVGAGTATIPDGSGTGNRNSFFGQDAGRNNTTGFVNSFFGQDAGQNNTTGSFNSFFGQSAGQANTTGGNNSFFGTSAGQANTTGGNNSFFGLQAGRFNTTGASNSFFGMSAGFSNTTGVGNSFFGVSAGFSNTTGVGNSFFGPSAGRFNTTGHQNSFFGASAGISNTTGVNNTIIGVLANVSSGSLTNATAIGAFARVDQSNSLVLGSINGVNACEAANNCDSVNVGIGTTTPTAKLSVVATGDGARVLHLGTERAWVFRQFGTGAATALELTGDDANNNNKHFVINTAGNVGIGTTGPLDKLHVFGDMRIGASTSNPGCVRNFNSVVLTGSCPSDLRFKRDLSPFPSLLNKVTQLRPVHYYWRASDFPQRGFGDALSYGLVAQEVERILPELVSEDTEGFKQVDYSKLPLMLLQAVKEQQAQIETLQQMNRALNERVKKLERAQRKKSASRRR